MFSSFRRIRSLLSDFASEQHGSIATTFALSLLPVVLTVGAAVDYSFANGAKAKLDALADAAALSAVSKPSMALTADKAKDNALKMFNAQVTGIKNVTIGSVSATVTDSGKGRTALVNYTASTPTSLMGIVGMNKMSIKGDSTASSAIPTFIDFYLLLDNTPSMGVGATPADVAKMVANTSDKCAFACHDLSDSNNYYKLAKKLNVTMRIDVVRQATEQLMDTAKTTATVSDQFRAGIYTFGSTCTVLGLTTVTALTDNLPKAKAAAKNIDLMTIPYQGYYNDQCTDYDGTLTAINKVITNPGDGKTAAAPQKYLFYVTDGVADANNPGGCSQPLTGGTRCQEPIDIAFCKKIKDRGIKIAVLYTTYLPLPTNDWYNNWIKPFTSKIAPEMQKCASPDLYFEVSPTQGISDAMTALFQKAVGQARLTQ